MEEGHEGHIYHISCGKRKENGKKTTKTTVRRGAPFN